MSWTRESPDYAPSPDPASAAEEHFYQQSLHETPEDETCPDCRGRGWFVGREPKPGCEVCHGDGFYFGHTEACADDECALNADLFSCDGETQPCDCTVVNCDPCSVRAYNEEVAYQESLADSDEDAPF